MNKTDKKIYDFILKYGLKNDCLPTVREICKGTGYSSTATVFMHMENLKKEGLLCRKKEGLGYSVKALRYHLDDE